MKSIKLDDLTPFGRLAVRLDLAFAELGRVAGELAGTDIGSDAGLDEGVKLLQGAARNGQDIAETMQSFAQALEQARAKAEADTRVVAERAELIHARRQSRDALREKLEQAKDGLKALGAGLSGLSVPDKSALSDGDKRRIAAELEKLQAPMADFIGAAQAIKAEAARLNFRRLERQADSIIDSLQASRKKISQAVQPPDGPRA